MKKTLLWVTLLLGAAGLFMIIRNRSCIMIQLSGLPQLVETTLDDHGQISKVVFLYDQTTCNVCPSGSSLDRFNTADVLFVITPIFSGYEIDNLADTFQLTGPIVQGDQGTERFIRRLTDCMNESQWERNLVVQLTAAGEIESVTGL